MSVADLIYGQIILVTGKGGVGKTTCAAALGVLAARQGRRTLVVEIDAQRPSMDALFGVRNRYEPTKVEDNLWVANIDWNNALHEWVDRIVPIRRVVNLILENRVVQHFLNATPGNREVVTLSKLVWLSDQYDLVVVDLPASGHAAALMAVPNRVLQLFKVGPLHERALEARKLLSDRRTGMVMVALPEEMVVNETIETWEKIRRDAPFLRIPLVLLNQSSRPTLSEAERGLMESLSERFPTGDAADLLTAGRWEARREAATARATERLSADTEMSLVEIARLSTKGGSAKLIQSVAAALARSALKSRGGDA